MGKKRKRTSLSHDGSDIQRKKSCISEDNTTAETTGDKFADCDVGEDVEMRNLLRSRNRKKKSGGFQSMGLCHPVFKGIMKKGYKVPTPIQRKTIPLLLDGKDVVAMARTGSGKTAAFLIPMFERLKAHSSAGIRALILSPTRELSLQTLKFTKEVGKFTGIKAATILGGDSMQDQFAALHENPDLIIATPGRLMHILLEMNLKLQSVEYVVFDEADRLFEMGFQDQLHSILARLPESRQTLLFSATLPKLLVDFAKAGLHDPTLIRLDVDTKISDQLQLAFLQCRSDDKTAVLLHLLQSVVKPSEQTVVFASTKHHVEFLNLVLTKANIPCSYSYSALDPTARKITVAKFRNKLTRVLVVTDLAARGIDIPMLDVVVNYNFPAKPKLFIHRVGRVARAGRTGVSYSLVSPDEIPFLIDLHLFLGRPLSFADPSKPNSNTDGIYGLVPQRVIDEEDEKLQAWKQDADLEAMVRVVNNAYKQYCKSRPAPSSESLKRSKSFPSLRIGFHPIFTNSGTTANSNEIDQVKLLEAMKSYRPHSTIFEINSTNRTQAFSVMKQKRSHDEVVIARKQRDMNQPSHIVQSNDADTSDTALPATDADVQGAFATVCAPKSKSDPYHQQSQLDKGGKKKKRKTAAMGDNFMAYRPKDYESEQGLSLGTSFEKDASHAVLDLTGDDADEMHRARSRTVWDRKRKRFVNETGLERDSRKVKTESGKKISSAYKTNIYQEWLQKNKVQHVHSEGEGEMEHAHNRHNRFGGRHRGRDRTVTGAKTKRQPRNELREKSQIVKERTKRAAKTAFQLHRTEQRRKRKGTNSRFKHK